MTTPADKPPPGDGGHDVTPRTQVAKHAPSRAMLLFHRRGPLLLTAVSVVAFFLVWDWLTTSGLIHRIIMPGPEAVFDELRELVREQTFWDNLWTTTREVAFGLLIGCSSAIAMALICTRYSLVRKVLQPYITTIQAVPKIVILPMLGIWFGLGVTSAVIVVSLIAFFPTYINTMTGLSLSAENGLRLLHSLGASRRQAFVMYRIPTALPLVFTGLKTSINYGVVGAITTEFLGAPAGLGFQVTSATTFLNIPGVYAAVAAITLLAALIYVLVEFLDRKLIFWRVDLDQGGRKNA